MRAIADIDAEELGKTLASRSGKLWGHVLDVRDREAWFAGETVAGGGLRHAGPPPTRKEVKDRMLPWQLQ